MDECYADAALVALGIPLESMDRLFEIKPVRIAHKQVHAEDAAREEDFRQDAENSGLSVAKDNVKYVEKAAAA